MRILYCIAELVGLPGLLDVQMQTINHFAGEQCGVLSGVLRVGCCGAAGLGVATRHLAFPLH